VLRGYIYVMTSLKFTYLFNVMNKVLLKTVAKLLLLALCLLRMTVGIPNSPFNAERLIKALRSELFKNLNPQ
jgi:hypothetical protein